MHGILILAHGSKRRETEATMEEVVRLVKEKSGERLVMPVYLQFTEPGLQAGITQLIDSGADSIKIIPFFLFAGIHLTCDIPRELAMARQKYPQLDIKLSKHLGADERIADIIIDRINSLA